MDFSSASMGLWLGFALSLMIFSLIIRDNLLARLAQYILVGAATGYLMVMVIQDILRPKLFEPLLTTRPIALDLLVPMVLGVGLVLVGLDGTIRQSNRSRIFSGQADTIVSTSGPVYTLLRGVGRIALMIILGVTIANAVTGSIQGTILPQFWQATRIRSFVPLDGGASLNISAAVALVVTIGTIVHLYIVPKGRYNHGGEDAHDPTVDPNGATENIVTPIGDNPFLQVWAGIGKRSLWFAAGVLFARLAASRLSLLIARIEYIVQTLETTSAWQQLIRFVQPFFN